MRALKSVLLAGIASIALLYIAASLFLAFKIHVALPAADLQTRSEFLLDAYQNGLSWEIFLPHNIFHWIVIPKAVLSLDMILLNGNGWFIKGVSVVTVLLTLVLVAAAIAKTPNISNYQRTLLIWLMCSLLGGPWILESLVNPISQYSMLCFFLVCVGYLLSADMDDTLRKIGVVISSLLLLMCSGQIFALLPALLVVRFKEKLPLIVKASLMFALLFVVIELINVFVLQFKPIIFLPFQLVLDKEIMDGAIAYYEQDRLGVLTYFANSVFYFMAKITLLQYFKVLSETPLKWAALAFYVVVITVLLRYKAQFRSENFWLLCFIFCLLTALLPAFLRMADGYSNRFANIGSLLFVSACMYFVFYQQGRFTNWLIGLLSIYLVLCAPYAYKDIELENKSILATSAVRTQVAYSIGLRNKDVIVNAPGAWWAELDANAIRSFAPDWQKEGIGVYSTTDYQIFAGSVSLPSQQLQCEYQIGEYFWYVAATDGETSMLIQGKAMAGDQAANKAIFYDKQTGEPIGRAVEQVGKSLWQLLADPPTWEGYLKLPSMSYQEVTAVAYGDDFSCQPYTVYLKP